MHAAVCSCRYYSLEVSYFKSSLDGKLLDSLWNKYWVNTLSSSSLLTVSECLHCSNMIRRTSLLSDSFIMRVRDFAERGLHDGPGARPCGEVGAERVAARSRSLHHESRHSRKEDGRQVVEGDEGRVRRVRLNRVRSVVQSVSHVSAARTRSRRFTVSCRKSSKTNSSTRSERPKREGR